jgi:FtsP/CotA-like multicopper oxidase with cupredoxin domain
LTTCFERFRIEDTPLIILPFRFRWSLAILVSFGVVAALLSLVVHQRQEQSAFLSAPPEVRSHDHVAALTLHAVRGSDGRDSFAFNGQTVAPIIRVSPGDTLNITYVNDLPPASDEQCSLGPCMNMTNLHFHGLGVSPRAPQDDVLTMIAMPGQTLNYSVHIPLDQPPGLYWYHTHPHGESERQVLDGMSGVIVIEGIERYVPELARLPAQVIILRGRSIEHDPDAAQLRRKVDITSQSCGGEAEKVEEIFTVNGAVRPSIGIAPGERQFWRIVNAAADRYVDVQLDGEAWEIVALDGMPLAYHDPEQPLRKAGHVLLPPASRLEAIVTGPQVGSVAALRSRCVDTGPDGDPNPAMVLADVAAAPPSAAPPATITSDRRPASYQQVQLAALESGPPQFVATFTEDKKRFYINNQLFDPDAAPMTQAVVGTYQHWRVVNQSKELHPMHLHQVHFLVYAVNGIGLQDPEWVDTANVPYGGSIDMIVDFTNPAIRGMSVFHCHLLNHEDKGMMAKMLLK